VDGALGFSGGGGFDGNEFGVRTKGGFDLVLGGGLDVGLEVAERGDEEMSGGAVGGVENEGVEDGGIVGVAVGGNLREGRRDENDIVAELAEAVRIGLHGEAGVEREVAFCVGEFGPVFGGERAGEIVGGEEEPFAAGGEEEHVDVFDDATGKRLEIGDGLAAGGFCQFLIDVDALVFVAGEERAGGEAAAIVEFEKIAAVESERGLGEVEIGSDENGVGDIVGGGVVIGALRRGFIEKLGEFAEDVEFVFDGGSDGFAGVGSEIGVEGVGALRGLRLLLANL